MDTAYNAHGLAKLKIIDNLADISEDTFKFTKAVNMMVNGFFFIPVDKWCCLIVVYGKTLFNRLFVII